jgi:hypothetical protein
MMINAAAPIPTNRPLFPDLDDPAARTFEGDDDGEAVGDGEGLFVFDALGDGFTEVLGVGDVVGVAVAVAVGFGLVCVGVGVGLVSLIVTRTSGSTS